MIARDPEGKITLSWAQAIWSIATIATVIGCYYGIQTKIDHMAFIVANDSSRIAALEERNRQAGFARSDASQLRDDIEDEIADLRKQMRRHLK